MPVMFSSRLQLTLQTQKRNNMKPYFFSLLALITLGWFSCQKDDGFVEPPQIKAPIDTPVVIDTVTTDSPEVEDNKSILWEISGNGLQDPAHLFGTIHNIPEERFAFEEQLEAIVGTSTSVMLELDITDQSVLQTGQTRLSLPAPYQPEDLYNEKEMQMLVRLCGALNQNWNMLKEFQPIASQSMIGSAFLTQETGKQTGYEEFLVRSAKRQNIDILGAESVDYVYTYFKDIDVKTQAGLLVEFGHAYENNRDSLIQAYDKLTEVYLDQDIDELRNQSRIDETSKKVYDVLIAQRNKAWMPTITKDLDGRLIAVGAGHLAGPKGLIELLRNEGYKVSPVSLKP